MAESFWPGRSVSHQKTKVVSSSHSVPTDHPQSIRCHHVIYQWWKESTWIVSWYSYHCEKPQILQRSRYFWGIQSRKSHFSLKESSRKMINCRLSWHCMDPNTSWISNCWNSMDSLVISWPWISGRLEPPASTRPCGRGRRPRWRAKWRPWGRRSRWRERSSFSVYFVFVGAATASTKTKWFR